VTAIWLTNTARALRIRANLSRSSGVKAVAEYLLLGRLRATTTVQLLYPIDHGCPKLVPLSAAGASRAYPLSVRLSDCCLRAKLPNQQFGRVNGLHARRIHQRSSLPYVYRPFLLHVL
jgi:hypothetical protein